VLDADGRRFLFEHHSDGELAPRDVVARAIAGRKSWLDCRHLDPQVLETEFPTVMASCRAVGINPVTDLIPVAPAAHYTIGGVQTDLDGRASIPRLYAIGECSSTGVHGANRLAGNSLAEALVFGRRAARAISGQRTGRTKSLPEAPELASTDIDVEATWAWFREAISEGLGIERDEESLLRLAERIEPLTRLPISADRGALELRAAAITARLMSHSASLRTESRGVHRRRDYPEPDPRWAGIRLRIARN
jgi:L-aspartate oxidase